MMYKKIHIISKKAIKTFEKLQHAAFSLKKKERKSKTKQRILKSFVRLMKKAKPKKRSTNKSLGINLGSSNACSSGYFWENLYLFM